MAHVAENFDHLIGAVKGLSERQLRAHFELYRGYVRKLEEIDTKLRLSDLRSLERDATSYSYSELSELQRRRSVAYNGARLHEYYFSNLTGGVTRPSAALARALNAAFDTRENWESDTLSGLKTANGWVLLCRSRLDGTLRNAVVEEHHRGLLVDQDVILAIDGWEHAFFIDYDVREADYFRAILPSIDWDVASRRFEAAEAFGSRAA